MSDQTTSLGLALFPTTNTKVAAMLLTLGVPFADPHQADLCRNIYSEQKPYRTGMPGEVTYLIGAKTAEGIQAADLQAAYDAAEADRTLDRLVDEIEAASPARGKRLRLILPLALAAYARGFYENRDRLLDLWKQARPMILIQRSETSWTLIPRNASAATRRAFGV